jgi:hypothetical protein
MVEIELRAPRFDEDRQTVEWEAVARIRVSGDHYELEDERGVIDLTLPVLNLRTGQRLHFAESPEEWARNLPTTYRGPELVAEILHDDAPPRLQDIQVEREPVEVPEIVQHHAVH